jgi:hypothetical protein
MGGQLKVSIVQDAPYLRPFIIETLRPNSAGSTGLPRITPPEKITICETSIPGNVTVYAL